MSEAFEGRYFTGASAARLSGKYLFLLAPLQKMSGAHCNFQAVRRHKKAPENRGFCESAPPLFAEVLRTLTTSGALVNTHPRASKMSVGQGRHTRSFRRCAKRHSRVATPLRGATRERRNACGLT
jgi:hypothetical protein